MHEEIISGLFQIKIKKQGSIFIESTSFTKQYYWEKISKWAPLAMSAIAIIITLVINFWPSSTRLKLEQTIEKVNSLQKQFDEFPRQVYPQNLFQQVDTLLVKDSL